MMKFDVTIPGDIFRAVYSMAASGDLYKHLGRRLQRRIVEWYEKKGEDWFDGPNHMDAPGGRTFMRGIADPNKWEPRYDAQGYSVEFSNKRPDAGNWGLRFQHYGGTVRPKRTKYLAIPLEPTGRNVGPRAYPHKLRYIFNRKNTTPGYKGSLVWQDVAGQLHAAFMLRDEVTLPPMKERNGHDALPPEDTLAAWAAEDIINKLKKL